MEEMNRKKGKERNAIFCGGFVKDSSIKKAEKRLSGFLDDLCVLEHVRNSHIDTQPGIGILILCFGSPIVFEIEV